MTKVTMLASEVVVGDQLDLSSGTATVTAITTYVLAYTNDVMVKTSTEGHRWPVFHFLTGAGGYVRFPHEEIDVLR